MPPVESLGPDSDYTVFLKKGVPEALRIAALRKAWMSDPFIRDFRSPAIDYGWDFTTPEYALRPGDDVEKMLDEIFKPKAQEPARPAPPPAEVAETPAAAEVKADARPDLKLTQNRPETVPPAAAPAPSEPALAEPRRKHGGALPE